MDVKAHRSEDIAELERRADAEKNVKQRDRLRAALLAIRGEEAPVIMTMIDRSLAFVQRWAYAYRDGGIEALRVVRQPGAPTKLPREREEEFQQRLLAGPTPADGVCTLRGRDAVRILEREFGAAYTLAGAYDLLHRLGFSCLRPAARHRKNDPEKMREFLESAPLLSKRSPKNTRTKRSKSGSKTKPASDSREP